MDGLIVTDYDKWLREADLKALEAARKGTGPAPVMLKDGGLFLKTETDGPMVFVASEESEDRMGDVIMAKGWQLENYAKNPVFLFAHDQSIPPIGLSAKTWVEGKQLLTAVRFDQQDAFAQEIQGKYQRKFMRGVSVGFKALDYEERDLEDPTHDRNWGILFKSVELVEISAVPVPAHPKALAKMLESRGLISVPSEEYIKRFEALEARLTALETPLEQVDIIGAFKRTWEKEKAHV